MKPPKYQYQIRAKTATTVRIRSDLCLCAMAMSLEADTHLRRLKAARFPTRCRDWPLHRQPVGSFTSSKYTRGTRCLSTVSHHCPAAPYPRHQVWF